MVWFKVDDGAHSHPKLLMVSLAAVGLWSMAGSWSGMHLTDGFIPAAALPTIRGDEALASELVRVGLWVRSEGGFHFHEWHRDSDGTERNPTSEEVKRKRSVRAEAGRKGGIASGNSRRANKTGSNGEANASAFVGDPLNPRPDPTREEEANASSSGTAAPRTKKTGTRIPEPFPVTPEMVEWASTECPLVDGKYETAQFCDYWAAKSGANAVKLDWGRTWKTWMRKAQKTAEERRPSNVVAIRSKQAEQQDMFSAAYARAAAREAGQA